MSPSRRSHALFAARILLCIVAFGCGEQSTTPLTGRPVVGGAASQSETPTGVLTWLAPLGTGSADPSTFDAAAVSQVVICAWSGTACIGAPVAQFAPVSSAGFSPLVANATTGQYEATWSLLSTAFVTRKTYRIRALNGSAELGAVSVDVVRGRWALTRSDGSLAPLVAANALPIRFHIAKPVITATQTLDAHGGTVQLDDGTQLTIPSGALSGATPITITKVTSPFTEFVSLYEFGPSGTTFSTPATLRVTLAPQQVPGPDEQVMMVTQAGPNWTVLPDSRYDPSTRTLTASISHFSENGVIKLPLHFAPNELVCVRIASDFNFIDGSDVSWDPHAPAPRFCLNPVDPLTGTLRDAFNMAVGQRVRVAPIAYGAHTLNPPVNGVTWVFGTFFPCYADIEVINAGWGQTLNGVIVPCASNISLASDIYPLPQGGTSSSDPSVAFMGSSIPRRFDYVLAARPGTTDLSPSVDGAIVTVGGFKTRVMVVPTILTPGTTIVTTVGHSLSAGQMPSVTASATDGSPIVGVDVDYQVSQGPCRLNFQGTPTTLILIHSDQHGTAALPLTNLNVPVQSPTTCVIKASVGNSLPEISTTFVIQVVAPVPLAIVTVPPSANATAYVPLSQQPVIQVLDQSGQPIPNTQVTAIVTSSAASVASGGAATTNSSGVATFNSLTLGAISTVTTDIIAPIRFSVGGVPFGATYAVTLRVPGSPVQAGVLTAAIFGTCALGSNSLASCWGSNSSGEFGDGTLLSSFVPKPAGSNQAFQKIEMNSSHTSNSATVCGLSNSQLFCWGLGNWGQLGNGTTANSAMPVSVPGTWSDVAVGSGFVCAISGTSPGPAYCWGNVGGSATLNGALGSSVNASAVPIPVSSGLSFRSITAGGAHACALTADGTAYCWGWNQFGQLGTGSNAATTVSSPSPVAGGFKFVSISAGGTQTCGIATSGAALCWGGNFFGSIGNGITNAPGGFQASGSGAPVVTPTPVVSNPGFVAIYAGRDNSVYTPSCGLTANGQAYCWGPSVTGTLATSAPLATCTSLIDPFTLPCTGTPVPISGSFAFSSLTVHTNHVCGVTLDHFVACWGTNVGGQLGDGTRTARTVPTPVVNGPVTP